MATKNSLRRNFNDKIALLTKKESEANAAFERIIKEVLETTRSRPQDLKRNYTRSHSRLDYVDYDAYVARQASLRNQPRAFGSHNRACSLRVQRSRQRAAPAPPPPPVQSVSPPDMAFATSSYYCYPLPDIRVFSSDEPDSDMAEGNKNVPATHAWQQVSLECPPQASMASSRSMPDVSSLQYNQAQQHLAKNSTYSPDNVDWPEGHHQHQPTSYHASSSAQLQPYAYQDSLDVQYKLMDQGVHNSWQSQSNLLVTHGNLHSANPPPTRRLSSNALMQTSHSRPQAPGCQAQQQPFDNWLSLPKPNSFSLSASADNISSNRNWYDGSQQLGPDYNYNYHHTSNTGNFCDPRAPNNCLGMPNPTNSLTRSSSNLEGKHLAHYENHLIRSNASLRAPVSSLSNWSMGSDSQPELQPVFSCHDCCPTNTTTALTASHEHPHGPDHRFKPYI